MATKDDVVDVRVELQTFRAEADERFRAQRHHRRRPIWLNENDIAVLEQEHGIEIAPRVGAAERAITVVAEHEALQCLVTEFVVADGGDDERSGSPRCVSC